MFICGGYVRCFRVRLSKFWINFVFNWLDVLLSGFDVVLPLFGGLDVLLSGFDIVLGGLDVLLSWLDIVLGGLDVFFGELDIVLGGLNVIFSGLDFRFGRNDFGISRLYLGLERCSRVNLGLFGSFVFPDLGEILKLGIFA